LLVALQVASLLRTIVALLAELAMALPTLLVLVLLLAHEASSRLLPARGSSRKPHRATAGP
jgi:hypothetical protein